jgi:hypothetical protein
VRSAYATLVAKARAKREQTFRRLRLDHVTVRTSEEYVRALVDLFRARQSRMKRYG